MSFKNQFAHPHGFGGRAAGWIMGSRTPDGTAGCSSCSSPSPVITSSRSAAGRGWRWPRSWPAGCQVTAVDPSEVMRAMAGRRNAAAVADGRVRILDGSAEDLPDGPFAAVYASNTPQFWADIDATLADVARRLLPGGQVALAIQPRFKGATDADARRLADENAGCLRRAGFEEVRLEVLALPTDRCGLCPRSSQLTRKPPLPPSGGGGRFGGVPGGGGMAEAGAPPAGQECPAAADHRRRRCAGGGRRPRCGGVGRGDLLGRRPWGGAGGRRGGSRRPMRC